MVLPKDTDAMSKARLRKALTIAGSDSGGGAGIQADLKTFAALDVYGTCAITSVTAQNSLGVNAVEALPPGVVRAQIDAVLQDIGADAVKIGMLANSAIALSVAEALDDYNLDNVVLDPVMVAASGDRLLDAEAVDAIRDELMPRCQVVTPNLDEAAMLTDRDINDLDGMRDAARTLLERGAQSVLVKGGHLEQSEADAKDGGGEVVDVFARGEDTITIVNQRLEVEGHGTGCTLSSALAAYLARGLPLEEALREACAYLHQALRHGYRVGGGDPVVLEHFWPQRFGP